MKKINKKEIERLLYIYKINKVIRYGQKREEKFQTQSVAEHIADMIFLAYYFRELEPLAKNLNFEKVIKIILLHDLGEIETGDIPAIFKTKQDFADESKAIRVVKKKIPKVFAEEILDTYKNFEELREKESIFVKALDAMDALLFWQTEDGIEMLKSGYKNKKEFPQKEKEYYLKKTALLNESSLKTMSQYYEQIYRQSEMWEIINKE